MELDTIGYVFLGISLFLSAISVWFAVKNKPLINRIISLFAVLFLITYYAISCFLLNSLFFTFVVIFFTFFLALLFAFSVHLSLLAHVERRHINMLKHTININRIPINPFDQMTWPCFACKRMRINEFISIHVALTNFGTVNLKYCNDNDGCFEAAFKEGLRLYKEPIHVCSE